MRILAVTPYYPPEGGGLERYAHEILSRLAGRGHVVEALSFTKGTGPTDFARPHEVQVEGVSLTRLRPPFIVGNSPVSPAFLGQVRRRIRETRPDVVVGHSPVPFPAEMAFLAARKEEVPFVLTYHAGMLHGSSPLLAAVAALDRATLQDRMVTKAAGLIAVGPYVRDNALARARGPVTVIPPGVDAARFRSAGPPPGPNILFVAPLARGYRWKGLDVIWEAFPRVLKRVPGATLTLVGGGDRLGEFQRAARPGDVRVLGRIGEEALLDEYRRAAVVVLPSTSDAESFGMVLAEANACGRPVVASDVGGIPDFVRHGDNGLLARAGDAGDLAAKLIQVLSDPERARAMGENGRARVAREHHWDGLAARTEAALSQAVGDSEGPRG